MANQLVTIQQAARNALSTWLTTELAPAGGGDGVLVEPRWFEPDRPLPARAISIIDAGPRQIEWLEPEVLASVENAENADHIDITWALGAVAQRVQLDVWAQSDVELDDIVARLDRSLNAGERGVEASNVVPFRPGVLLELADGWDPGRVDFLFGEPEIVHTASSVGEGEWRAIYRGRFDGQLVQTATTAKMARLHLDARLREQDPASPDETPETTTITLPVT